MGDVLLTKIGDPTLDASDPWADDVFERREHGARLERLIRNTPGAFVIALKAPWGAGKSVFLRRLEAHLEGAESAVPVVRIDAWRNDFLPDPLAVLTIALNERVNRNPTEHLRSVAGELASQIADVGAKLLPAAVSIAASVITGGISQVLVAGAEATRLSGEALLKQYADHREAAVQFKKLLSRAVSQLTRQPADPTVRRPPLVILIDELDRCRPDFAIRMLECVKHFFDVEGCVFLIATDGGNLPAAVKSQYGPGVDGERYLRRFFDLEYHLPEPSAEQIALQFFRDAGLLPDDPELGAVRNDLRVDRPSKRLQSVINSVELFEAFAAIAPRLGLSIRDCGQALTALAALARSVPDDLELLPVPLTLAVLLRFAAPEEYDAIRRPGGALSTLLRADTHKIARGPNNALIPLSSLTGCEHRYVGASLRIFSELGAESPEARMQIIQQRMNHAGNAYPYYQGLAMSRFLALPRTCSADEHLREVLGMFGVFSRGE